MVRAERSLSGVSTSFPSPTEEGHDASWEDVEEEEAHQTTPGIQVQIPSSSRETTFFSAPSKIQKTDNPLFGDAYAYDDDDDDGDEQAAASRALPPLRPVGGCTN
jgi:hypothetical protein